MKKRTETLFLRIFRNTLASGAVIALLFAGMIYSLWYILDQHRILDKFVVFGKIKLTASDVAAPRPAFEHNAQLLLLDADAMRKYLQKGKELTIVFPQGERTLSMKAVVTEGNHSGDKTRQFEHYAIRLTRISSADQRLINLHSLEGNLMRFEIRVRTRKLWQAIMEKNA